MQKGTVLVTGGTCRIGRAIAEELRAAGWRVLTSSHRADAGADFVSDFSDPSAAVRLYAAALAAAPDDFRAIVNNAALFTGEASLLEAVNVVAPRKLTTLLAGREGVSSCAVVNILDARTLGPAAETDSAYVRTKRALLAETRTHAALFAQSLRVNAVAPGPVLPPEGLHVPSGPMLLDRRPAPADVAAAVRFLLEAEAVTGVVLPVDAGQHLLTD
jgi:NAD(P)-dependent dehydrogenase (short-subunit alcohol dehydrogenase family)